MTDLYQSGPATSNQFLRKWSLTLLGPNGQSWTLSDSQADGAQSGGTTTIHDPLRITFQTRQTMVRTPGYAEITVYNMSLSYQIKGLRKLYNRVILRAGYQTGRFATIFDGFIQNWKVGRDPDLTETYMKLYATIGDFPQNLANVNFSLAAGGAVQTAVNQIVASMSDLGATPSTITGLSQVPLIRGVVHYGMATDELRNKYGLEPFIQNGNLYVSPLKNGFTIGEAVTLNAGTGLIGMAEITGDGGVEFDCLLNPLLGVRSPITLNDRDINQASGSSASGVPGSTISYGPSIGQLGFYVDPSADGTYAAVVVEHHGDTRGNEWTTHVRAWPNGAGLTPNNPNLPYVNISPTTGQVESAVAPPIVPTDPALPPPAGQPPTP